MFTLKSFSIVKHLSNLQSLHLQSNQTNQGCIEQISYLQIFIIKKLTRLEKFMTNTGSKSLEDNKLAVFSEAEKIDNK